MAAPEYKWKQNISVIFSKGRIPNTWIRTIHYKLVPKYHTTCRNLVFFSNYLGILYVNCQKSSIVLFEKKNGRYAHVETLLDRIINCVPKTQVSQTLGKTLFNTLYKYMNFNESLGWTGVSAAADMIAPRPDAALPVSSPSTRGVVLWELERRGEG